MKNSIRSALHYWLPLLAGTAMLFIPLLRDFHIESALLVALVGCFWSAWSSCSKESAESDARQIGFIVRTLYLIGGPLLIYSILTGCLSWHGIGFWILYPLPSVLFGYSLGRLLRIWNVPARRVTATVILCFIAFGVLIFEFFSFPQVYFFNHVWGGWPGPIYDETVKITWSLVFFRGLTLLWVGLFWLMPLQPKSVRVKTAVGVCSIMLIASYTQLPEMGIISPRSYLQEQLKGTKTTAHFSIYYDMGHYSEDEISFIAQKHEFYFQQIVNRLNIDWPGDADRIQGYLYAHPWQKKKLVGAKFTSYVPVWLDQDQLHIAKPQIAGSLKHELVHVLAKQFGNRLFNASWSIGLIEGLAVAVAPNESPVTTIDQIVVSEKPYPTVAEMEYALSPLGFYGGRSAVNYTQSGSFTSYLLNHHPVSQFKEAYGCGRISEAYRLPLDSLVKNWHQALDTVSVDSTDQQVAQRLYGFPSLFEQQCPHVQSDFTRIWDRYEFYMAERDTARAVQHLEQARKKSPGTFFVKNRWAYLNLKMGNIQKVQQQASKADSTIDGLLLYADAFALTNKWDIAGSYIAEAVRRLQEQPDSLLQPALQMRQDSVQWKYYRDIVYEGNSVVDSIFSTLVPRTQARAIARAIETENRGLMTRYAKAAFREPADLRYFDIYLALIERLAFFGNDQLARKWLQKVAGMALRTRYKQRLAEVKDWIGYLQQKKEVINQ